MWALALNHPLVFAQSCLRWVELLAASQGTPKEALAQGRSAQPNLELVGFCRPRQSCPICLAPGPSGSPSPTQSLAPTSAQLGRKGKNSEQRRGAPIFIPPPSGRRAALCPGHSPDTPPEKSPPSRCAEGQSTSGHRWPYLSGYSSGLSGYWLLAASRRTQQAAGTHVRTRESVWGSPFLGQSLHISAGSLGVPPARRRSCARHCHWLGPSLPRLPLMRPRKFRGSLLPGAGPQILASFWGQPQVHSESPLVFPSLALCGRSRGLTWLLILSRNSHCHFLGLYGPLQTLLPL